MKIAVVATILLYCTCAQTVQAHGNVPEDIDALIHAAAEYRGASYTQMERVLRCESGGYDRRVIDGARKGRAGEIGIAQILPKRGLGPLFESRGGDYSASDSIYFMAWAFTHGLRSHWSC
jgi:hypothetical protein